MSAAVQGGLIRRLVPRFGEAKLIVAGLTALVLGLAAIAGVGSLPTLLGATLIVAVGQGLASPSISGLLSRSTPPSEQGAVFGTLSSAQTLARMVSYSVANLALAPLAPGLRIWEARRSPESRWCSPWASPVDGRSRSRKPPTSSGSV